MEHANDGTFKNLIIKIGKIHVQFMFKPFLGSSFGHPNPTLDNTDVGSIWKLMMAFIFLWMVGHEKGTLSFMEFLHFSVLYYFCKKHSYSYTKCETSNKKVLKYDSPKYKCTLKMFLQLARARDCRHDLIWLEKLS